MSAPDCVGVWAFRETVGLTFGDVDVRSQIRSTHFFTGSFELRIDFKELGLADTVDRPTPFGSIMGVDEIFHGFTSTE
jgi:hypothetical protein